MGLSFQIIRYALFALVVVSLGTWGARTWRSTEMDDSATTASVSLPTDGIAVINFHGATRCTSCRKISETAHALVKNDFASDLQSGRLTWHVINFDESTHNHYVKDYGLVSSTIVVVRREHGRDLEWRRLDAVWDHIFDIPAMNSYLQREIAQLSTTAPKR